MWQLCWRGNEDKSVPAGEGILQVCSAGGSVGRALLDLYRPLGKETGGLCSRLTGKLDAVDDDECSAWIGNAGEQTEKDGGLATACRKRDPESWCCRLCQPMCTFSNCSLLVRP